MFGDDGLVQEGVKGDILSKVGVDGNVFKNCLVVCGDVWDDDGVGVSVELFIFFAFDVWTSYSYSLLVDEVCY